MTALAILAFGILSLGLLAAYVAIGALIRRIEKLESAELRSRIG